MIACKHRNILSAITALCFPPLCITCGGLLQEEGFVPFCPACFSNIDIITTPLCPRCGEPFAGGGDANHLCGECILQPPSFSLVRTFGMYAGPLLEAIHLFKYRKSVIVGERLGTMMARWTYDSFAIANYEIIIPVPLHPAKLKDRGFNQSLILARQIAGIFSIPVDLFALKKIKAGTPQVGLGREQRRENVRGTFAVTEKSEMRGLKVLLVDDVYTTGSTVRECARILMKRGAREVAVLTLARA